MGYDRQFAAAQMLSAEPAKYMEIALRRLLVVIAAGRRAIENGDMNQKQIALGKAGALSEFMVRLAQNCGDGALGNSLSAVFGFILSAVALGNTESSVERLDAAVVAIQELLTVWRSSMEKAA